MKRQRRVAAVIVTAAMLASASVGLAHPDHPDHGPGENQMSYEEDFPGEGVAQDKQHDSDAGHLPAKQENVELVGKAAVSNPSGLTGRIADVAAYGDYAYLNAFRDPVCDRGGVHVMDISDVTDPVEVGFIPTSVGSYAGEGVKVLPIAGMDVLIHQNETCPAGPQPQGGNRGGINLWDVTDPTSPVNLAMHAGDPSNAPVAKANDSHSFDAWTNQFTGRSYAALIDNFETTDVDILDITDPRNPVLINDTLDLIEETEQEHPDTLTSVFSHDMDVQRFGTRYIMSLNYWDGGYVMLDVTDPANATVLAETDYAEFDEERAARGHLIEPEGNAHQSEITPGSGRFMIGTDEDFNPFRVLASITSGPYADTDFVAAQASDTPPVTAATPPLVGNPTFVGLGCDPLTPVDGGIALVERGVCAFQVKLDNIAAAGYDAGIVFNSQFPAGSTCLSLVTMLASGDIPFMFVNRAVGLQILQVPGVTTANACDTVAPAAGSETAAVDIRAVFDGWGYVRLFSTQVPRGRTSAAISQIDTYAVPESQDAAYGVGFGDLSVHEVAMDPNPDTGLAYISYYAAGFRVVKYGNRGIQEVGAFIDEGGNNFWGVEVHEVGGEQVVLASDRDFGLYIFRYTGG